MLQSFFAKIDGKYQGIPFGDVDYIEANKNYVRIVTANNRFLIHATMKQMEGKMPHHLFFRIHKSYIVAINRITAFDHEYLYLQNTRLPLGANYFEPLKGRLVIICSEVKQVKRKINQIVAEIQIEN